MGSSTEHSRVRPDGQPVGPRAGAGRQQRRLGGGRGRLPRALCDRHRHRRLDPPAGRADRHRRPEADVRPGQPLRDRRVRLVARPDRAVRPGRPRRRRAAARGRRPRRARLDLVARARARRRCWRCLGRRRGGRGAPGQAPRPARASTSWRAWSRASRRASARRSRRSRRPAPTVEDVSLPHTDYGLATYYIVAPAEASANLARYDGVRYGPRLGDGSDVLADYLATRGEGFGPEVKRRIMLGTYALSAGYYDAYYLKAQKVRTLIKGDFDGLWAQGFDALVAPTSPTVAFRFGARMADPVAMYLSDACTLPVNMAGLPGISVPAGLSDGLPVGLQFIGRRGRRRSCSRWPAATRRSPPMPSGAPWSRPTWPRRPTPRRRRRRARPPAGRRPGRRGALEATSMPRSRRSATPRCSPRRAIDHARRSGRSTACVSRTRRRDARGGLTRCVFTGGGVCVGERSRSPASPPAGLADAQSLADAAAVGRRRARSATLAPAPGRARLEARPRWARAPGSIGFDASVTPARHRRSARPRRGRPRGSEIGSRDASDGPRAIVDALAPSLDRTTIAHRAAGRARHPDRPRPRHLRGHRTLEPIRGDVGLDEGERRCAPSRRATPAVRPLVAGAGRRDDRRPRSSSRAASAPRRRRPPDERVGGLVPCYGVVSGTGRRRSRRSSASAAARTGGSPSGRPTPGTHERRGTGRRSTHACRPRIRGR